MNSRQLKIIAAVTMLIDHLAARCFYGWGIGAVRIPALDMNVYTLMRVIGRIAFLIYAFEISEGVKYTHSLVRYAGRLALRALLSEIPFDFCLFGLHLLPSQQASEGFLESIDWRHQNVFFTLLLGMLAASWMRVEREAIDRRVPPDGTRKSRAVRILLTVGRFAVWAGLMIAFGWLAKDVIHCDYRAGGVALVAICGLCNEPWERIVPLPYLRIVRVVLCALGLWACIRINDNPFEEYAAIALIFIGLYNGKKGYSSRRTQMAFYFFYPVHLMGIGLLAAATGV